MTFALIQIGDDFSLIRFEFAPSRAFRFDSNKRNNDHENENDRYNE